MEENHRQNAKTPNGEWGFEPSSSIDESAHCVIGAAIEVHRLIGPGYPEIVYERALCIELGLRAIKYARQSIFRVDYKGYVVGEGKMDLIVDPGIVVEAQSSP